MSITSFEALITDPKELYNGQLQTLNECHREKKMLTKFGILYS